MANAVFSLCAITSALCAFMLMRGYRRERTQVLLWTSLCFAGLFVNNILLLFDTVILPDVNFHGELWRSLAGAIAGLLLLIGLVWDLT